MTIPPKIAIRNTTPSSRLFTHHLDYDTLSALAVEFGVPGEPYETGDGLFTSFVSELAVLTESGYRAIADAAPGHVEAVRRSLFDTLSDADVDTLVGPPPFG